MKHLRSCVCLLLAVLLVAALGLPAFADGETYSITVENTNTNVTISGNTYYAYKLFDVSYSADKSSYAYKVTSDFDGFAYDGKSGEALLTALEALTSNSAEMNAFAKAALAYVQTNSISPTGNVTIAEKSQTGTISLPTPGYYLVSGSATADGGQTITAACSLTTTAPSATINPKVDAPKLDKHIVMQNADGSTTKLAANSANIGDIIPFEITSQVPNTTGYNKYIFQVTDTLTEGMEYIESSLQVYVGDVKLRMSFQGDNTYSQVFTYIAGAPAEMKVIFHEFQKHTPGLPIKIKYSAVVTEKVDMTATGNVNEAKLTYSNNPNFTYEGDKPGGNAPVGETPKSVTKTYSTALRLAKVNEQGQSLTGAKFTVSGNGKRITLLNGQAFYPDDMGRYYMLKDGTYTTQEPTEETKNAYDSITQKYRKVDYIDNRNADVAFNTSGYVDKDGYLTIQGLSDGTYTITEAIAPEGYNLLKEPITITISSTPTLEGPNWVVKQGETPLTAKDNAYCFQVVNKTGTLLPATGGMGTTIFYLLGSVMALAAGILLITKKRMAA